MQARLVEESTKRVSSTLSSSGLVANFIDELGYLSTSRLNGIDVVVTVVVPVVGVTPLAFALGVLADICIVDFCSKEAIGISAGSRQYSAEMSLPHPCRVGLILVIALGLKSFGV